MPWISARAPRARRRRSRADEPAVGCGRGGVRALALAALAAATLAAVVAPARAQGVHLALAPGAVTVAPESTFTLDLQVTQAGAQFNGFDAVVTYDTTALAFVKLSPVSLQQGALMTGACGNTFHRFAAAADSLVINDVLLCANLFLTGPGQIYRLKFRALGPPRDTWVRIRRAQFYAAGLYVGPLWTSDAHVGIGVPVAVRRPAPAPSVRLRVAPDPARGAVTLALEGGAAEEASVVVRDALGRTVRRLAVAPGAAAARWDGRDDAGAPLPPGLYLVTWRAGGTLARARVTLLR